MIKRDGNKLFTSVEGIDVVEVNLFSEKTHCILYERLRIFFGDHNVGEQSSLNMSETRCEMSR
jgi:hypothetical protein